MARRDVDLLIHGAAQVVTCASATAKRGAAMRDVGLILDGAVAVDDGRIVEVGPSRELRARHEARREIDAAGKIVCPGFVDPHSHSDWSLLANPRAESTVRQGVTTEVVGNCGWTYAPAP